MTLRKCGAIHVSCAYICGYLAEYLHSLVAGTRVLSDKYAQGLTGLLEWRMFMLRLVQLFLPNLACELFRG